MKKAVFFDFDGVICDSEMLHVQIALDFYKKETTALALQPRPIVSLFLI